jgi:hypothetical protein
VPLPHGIRLARITGKTLDELFWYLGYAGLQLLLGGVMPIPTWKGAVVSYLEPNADGCVISVMSRIRLTQQVFKRRLRRRGYRVLN